MSLCCASSALCHPQEQGHPLAPPEIPQAHRTSTALFRVPFQDQFANLSPAGEQRENGRSARGLVAWPHLFVASVLSRFTRGGRGLTDGVLAGPWGFPALLLGLDHCGRETGLGGAGAS